VAIQLPIVSTFDRKGIKQAQGSLAGFTKSVVGVGAAIGAAFAVRAVTNFAKESISSASDLQESLNAVTVSFGDASDAVIKLGEDSATRLGVAQSAFNDAAVRFSAFAGRVVGEGGDVGEFIDDVTTRAADFASVFNIEVSEALGVFQSGLAGESEPLKRFGINLLQSEVQAYALREGIVSIGEAMTEDEKVQARYGLLMEETAKTAGDFANTSDGLANSQRILSANFEDIRAEIGTALLPVLEDLSTFMVENVVPALSEFFEEDFPGLVESATPLVEGFVDVLGGIGDSLKDFFDIDADTSLLEGLLDKISALESDPEFQEFMGQLRDIILELAPVVPDLAIAIADVAKAIAPLLGDAAAEASPTLTGFAEIVGGLAEAFQILTGTIPDSADEMKDFEVVWTDFIPVIGAYLGEDGIIAGLGRAVSNMVDRLQEEAPQIALFWAAMKQITDAALDDFGGSVRGTLETMGQVFSGTWDDIVATTTAWRERQREVILGAIEEMYLAALDVMQGLFNGFKERFAVIAEWFMAKPVELRMFFGNPLLILQQIGADIFTGLWNGLKSIWPRISSWVSDKVESIKSAFRDAMKIGSPSKVFEGYGKNIVEGLLIGLDSLSPNVDTSVSDLVSEPSMGSVPMGGGRGGDIYVTVNAGMGTNGPQVGEEIVAAIKRYERSSGRVFASA